MKRNRQVLYGLLLVTILFASNLYVFKLNQTAGVIFFFCLLLIFASFLVMEQKRKKRIKKLSQQLRRVLAGDYIIEFQDYEEGELSALSADLYKIMVAFREQNIALLSDKEWLADSLSDISHQLKTPITSMLMLTDLLKKDLDEEHRKHFLMQLGNQAERLQWLVKNLLTLSRLDAQSVLYHPQAYRAEQIIKLASEPFLTTMDLKNQELKPSGDLEMLLCVDANWLAEALGNLIKNASEHAAQQTTIEIKAQDLPMNKIISVTNQGSIPLEDRPQLFTRFYRGKNASPDSVGIGLVIAGTIVRQQGGDIELFCEANQTTFSIRFPK